MISGRLWSTNVGGLPAPHLWPASVRSTLRRHIAEDLFGVFPTRGGSWVEAEARERELNYNQVVSGCSLNSPGENAGVQCYQSSIVRNRQGKQVNVR